MPISTAVETDLPALLLRLQQGVRGHRGPVLYQQCLDALSLARAQGDDALFVQIALVFARVMDQDAYSDASIATLQEGLERSARCQAFAEQAQLLYRMGRAHYARAQYRHALDAWTEGLEVARRADDLESWGWCKLGVGQVCDALDAPALAVEVFSELAKALDARSAKAALPPLEELRLFNGVNKGVNELRLGHLAEALDLFADAHARALRLSMPDLAGECAIRMAEVSYLRQDHANCLQELDLAEPGLQGCAHHWALANLDLLRAQCQTKLGTPQIALQSLDRAMHHAMASGANHVALRIAQQAAETAELANDLPRTVQAFKDALRLQGLVADTGKSQVLRDLEDLADLRISPERRLLQVSNHPLLEDGNWVDAASLLCEEGRAALGTDRAVYWSLSEDGLHALACAGMHTGQHDVPRSALGALWQQLVSGHPVLAHNARYHPDTRALDAAYLQPLNIVALLAYPVQVDGMTVGAFSFEQVGNSRGWARDALSLANQVALMAGRSLTQQARQADRARIDALNAALQDANQELEQRVQERSRQAEMALRQVAQAERMAALGSLVAGVAHELNTPIGNTLVMASTLQDRVHDLLAKLKGQALRRSDLEQFCSDVQEGANLLVASAASAAELISNFKQVAVDRTSANRRSFDLHRLVDEVLLTLNHMIKSRPITVRNQIAPGWMLDSYPGPMGQVVTNLFMNALIHGIGSAPDRAGCITIKAEPLGNGLLRLRFHDNGDGIAPAHLGKVFHPFFTTRMGQGGSGLGLSIVHSIVTELLKGEIDVHNASEGGAEFLITLPLVCPSEPPANSP